MVTRQGRKGGARKEEEEEEEFVTSGNWRGKHKGIEDYRYLPHGRFTSVTASHESVTVGWWWLSRSSAMGARERGREEESFITDVANRGGLHCQLLSVGLG